MELQAALKDYPIHTILPPLPLPPPLARIKSKGKGKASRYAIDAPFDLKHPYTRVSWLVPLIGPARHPLASGATFLHTASALPPFPTPPSSNPNVQQSTDPPLVELTWTPIALAQFWAQWDLTRKKKSLGSIGIYFERASCSVHPSQPTPEVIRKEIEKEGEGDCWIRIYCDAQVALKVRRTIALFYPIGEAAGITSTDPLALGRSSRRIERTGTVLGEEAKQERTRHMLQGGGVGSGQAQAGGANVQKRNMMKGVRLVLVDDLGRPAVIS